MRRAGWRRLTSIWRRQTVSKWLKCQRIGLILLLAGCISLAYGVHRDEHETVGKKSNMICLECIGIG